MIWALLSAVSAVGVPPPPLGTGPCDAETKPLTSRWEHAFASGSGAFFGRGPTPLLSSSLRWMPSYALDPGGDHRLGLIVGAALQNPELDAQIGARYSAYHSLLSFAAGYEISPEVVVGLRTGHVRVGAGVDLALIKTLRIGLRPQLDLPRGWPVLELVASFALAGSESRLEGPTGENEDLSRWDSWLALRVRTRASALFASRPDDSLSGAARESANAAWDRQCRDRERRLRAFLRGAGAAPNLDALIDAMHQPIPEFAEAVRMARRDAPIPPEAPPAAAVAAALKGLRRAAQMERS